MLYIHKDILSTDVKLKLADSLILSSLSYCDTVYWPALLNKDKESLQKIQNACLRFSYNLRKFDHISPSFLHSKWFNLNERFNLHLSCLIFKLLKNDSPEYLVSKFTKLSEFHGRVTRNCDLFCIPKHKTAQFQRSFSYNAAKNYNTIPTDVKSVSSINLFKKKIKSIIYLNR